jgi:hypothetical protein
LAALVGSMSTGRRANRLAPPTLCTSRPKGDPEQHRCYSDAGHLIFCTKTGRRHAHGNVLRGLYRALDLADIPRTSFHSLRHTHASLWIKDGGDVITLSKRLGHSIPQVTMTTYAVEIEEANDNAVRRARVNAIYADTGMAKLFALGAPNHDVSQGRLRRTSSPNGDRKYPASGARHTLSIWSSPAAIRSVRRGGPSGNLRPLPHTSMCTCLPAL